MNFWPMKMELTSTEKLIIATGYALYGSEEKQQIFQYIRCNGIELQNIDEIYNEIKKESTNAGYSDPVVYCEDVRYVKAIQKLQEYKDLLYRVLENKVDLDELDLSSEEDCDIRKQSLFDDTEYKDINQENFLEQYSDTLERFENQRSEQLFQIEPKNLYESASRINKTESFEHMKNEKIFYMKTNEEGNLVDGGKRVDDYLEGSYTNIKRKFDRIMKNMKNFRIQEKDRRQWAEEIKKIIEYAISLLGHKENFNAIYNGIHIFDIPDVIMTILTKIQ